MDMTSCRRGGQSGRSRQIDRERESKTDRATDR